ncbi:MAG: DUF547 domain-containing protein [Planctomycetota bacterium]|nr:DUF547 domain-containing protein [Planctomycetota bacterium]
MLALALLLTAVQDSGAPRFDHTHAAWTPLLREHVHDAGLVDYPGLGKRRAEVDAYLAGLAAVKATEFADFKPAQREAFWINAYNAWTIALILDHPKTESIRDLGGLFSSVFDKRFVPLQHLSGGKKPLSLSEIEHEILGRTARTPLFHFAIVCASRSCPELRAEAYDAARLDAQLAEQARRFLADPIKNDVVINDGTLRISKIFDWSEKELDGYPGGIRAILLEFGPEAIAQHPDLARVRLKHRDYDWSLNAWIPPAK